MEDNTCYKMRGSVLVGYDGNEASIDIPEEVTAIGYKTFYDNKKIEKVVLPNNLEIIACEAFKNCSNLSRITIGSNTKFGPEVFGNCYGLVDENGMIIINGVLFQNDLYKGTEVHIPEKVHTVDQYAFRNSNVEVVFLPPSVTKLSGGAFSDCKKLKTINLPEYMDILGYAFSGCESLEKVRFPKPINEKSNFYNKVFEGCTSLKEISIPAEVKGLKDTFADCSNLEKVVFEGDNITLVGDVFKNCEKLQIFCTKKLEKCLPKEYKKLVFKDEKTRAEAAKKAQALKTATGGIIFYERIDDFDIESMLKETTREVDVELIKAPKDMKITAKVNGRDIKINSYIGKGIKNDLFDSHCDYIDLYEASNSMLTKEETRNMIKEYDQTSDAFNYANAVVNPWTDKLSEHVAKRRHSFIYSIAHILSQETNLIKIAECFPSKKDGTFNKSKVYRIACDVMVRRPGGEIKPKGYNRGTHMYRLLDKLTQNDIFEIYAKAKDDTTLNVYAGYRINNEFECEYLKDDYLSQHYKELGLDKYL